MLMLNLYFEEAGTINCLSLYHYIEIGALMYEIQLR